MAWTALLLSHRPPRRRKGIAAVGGWASLRVCSFVAPCPSKKRSRAILLHRTEIYSRAEKGPRIARIARILGKQRTPENPWNLRNPWFKLPFTRFSVRLYISVKTRINQPAGEFLSLRGPQSLVMRLEGRKKAAYFPLRCRLQFPCFPPFGPGHPRAWFPRRAIRRCL